MNRLTLLSRIVTFSLISFCSVTVSAQVTKANDLTGTVTLLPLRFIDFKEIQNDNSITLTWTTIDESVIETYEIQRSNNGIEFVTISKQNSAKNLNRQQSYSTIDIQPVQKQAYYRIRAVSQSGKIFPSKIITVQEKKANNNKDLKLTATRHELAISSNNNSKEKITYRVMSIEGIVLQQGHVLLVSNNSTKVPLASVKSGLYLVSLNNGTVRQSKQIFIH